MKPQPVVIRKYGNRRLYDTSASRYINLDGLAALVRNGTEVQVVDAKTGEDLTRVTLTQVIVENAKEQPGALPLELLRQIIVASDHAGREFLSWYLKTAFDSYQKVEGAVSSGLSQVGAAALSPLQAVRGFLDVSKANVLQEKEELADLRQRIAELEARAGAAPEKSTGAPRGKRSPRRLRAAPERAYPALLDSTRASADRHPRDRGL